MDTAVVQMDLAHNPSAPAGIVDGVLRFIQLPIESLPEEQLLVRDLDLSPVPQKIDAVFVLMQVPLNPEPASNRSFARGDVLLGSARGAGLLVTRKPLPAISAEEPGLHFRVDDLECVNGALRGLDDPRLVTGSAPD